jgi:hypothetical protein
MNLGSSQSILYLVPGNFDSLIPVSRKIFTGLGKAETTKITDRFVFRLLRQLQNFDSWIEVFFHWTGPYDDYSTRSESNR